MIATVASTTLLSSASRGAFAEAKPAAAAANSAAPTDRSKVTVCTDGKKHFVAIGPDEQRGNRIYYGDDKKLSLVDPRDGNMMGGDWFWDPRQYNKQNNSNLRGLDLRQYSHVDYSAEKKTCELTCGTRVVPLTILAATEASVILDKATFSEAPVIRMPHALARDQNAVYYYVDKGSTEETEHNFRLFVGKKGALKLQKMTDVASDSEGQIFATKSGSLKLILDKHESSWVEGSKVSALVLVPVEDNLRMIYTELGVYDGIKLGTPCDDM